LAFYPPISTLARAAQSAALAKKPEEQPAAKSVKRKKK